MPKKPSNIQRRWETFEDAARRIREEGEAMPFHEVLRRIARAKPKHKSAKRRAAPKKRPSAR